MHHITSWPKLLTQIQNWTRITKLNKNENENKIEIYNLSGQKVLATSITNSLGFYNKEINLSSLNSGIYMLKFTSGNYQKTKKIVIQ